MAETKEKTKGKPKIKSGSDDSSEPDRIAKILESINSNTEIPEKFHRKVELLPLDELEKELKAHPFFMTGPPPPGEPLSPLLEAFQQLKYSETDNTPEDLALSYKEDGLFHFKLGKYRIASSIFTEGLKFAEKGEDKVLTANLYNNRGVCQFYIENYRSALSDFRKAVENKNDYEKSMKKAVECCIRLEKWEEGIEWVKKMKSLEVDGWEEMEGVVLRGGKAHRLSLQKQRQKSSAAKKSATVLLEKLKTSGIKILNENFLLENDDAHVTLINDEFTWPVLFYYPEYSQSDFIKEFSESDQFLPHLKAILDQEPPNWDKNKEYSSGKVKVYFVDGKRGGWVEVNVEESLGNVLRKERYHLPTNGVPGFFVLAENEFCKFFLERME